MTGRSLRLAAVGTVVVAALGVAARPLLPHAHHDGVTSPIGTPVAATTAPAQLVAAAVQAAVAAMRCTPRGAMRRPGCGRHTVTGAAGYPSGTGRFPVRIVGALTGTDGVPVPVALRVQLVEANGPWSTTVVAP